VLWCGVGATVLRHCQTDADDLLFDVVVVVALDGPDGFASGDVLTRT
jgi:hypothetical protein